MIQLLRKAFTGLITHGALEVVTAGGSRFVAGQGNSAAAAMRFLDKRAEWAFLLDPELKLGELYMDGRWVVERGSLFDVLSLLVDNAKRVKSGWWMDALDWLRFGTRRWRQRNDPKRSQRNVAHHYDLGESLYDLFLDTDRQYSCAYFEHSNQSLEDAQLAKKRHITAKLNMVPGQSVLDIGCGWGGMALYLAEVAEARRVLGVTLSLEQLNTATRRVAERGLSDRVEFRLQDYRDLDEGFDRIVSVGMFEHVGLPNYDTFFRQCKRLLREDGVMLLHTIGCTGKAVHADPWLDKYIFPGGYTPTLSQMIPAVEASGLVISDIEVLRIHYASTLRVWRERFEANREKAMVFSDERFCRMWEFYLTACETVFIYDDVVVFQLLLAARNNTVPLTRDYIMIREAELKCRETAVNDLEMCAATMRF